MIKELKKEFEEKANPEKAKQLQRFFKTGKGEYGEGDIFLGISVPEQRKTAKKFKELSLENIQELLNSKIHEHRLVALVILTEKFQKSKQESERKKLFEFYMKNYNNINNWDLVDISAHKIAGPYLIDKNKSILYSYAKSNHLWKKRIAMISTAYFIKNNEFEDTIKIAKILLHNKHDLIHKAVGWMLREMGKKDQEKLEKFLEKYHKEMPRTMLRYSLEKFSKEKRKHYMKK